MIDVKNISKRFGGQLAVSDVSFNVEPGEIFCLIGPNGAGKTTIVKMIAGLLRPTSGAVSLGGFDVVGDPERAKALVGYVPDDPVVWSGMTGREFLQFTGALYGMKLADKREGIEKLLSVFGLRNIADEWFEDYSRGNKQKFAIIAALLHKPKVLLIDEPIVGLDPESSEIAKKIFVDFTRDGGAVLLVTHTLGVAEEIASQIGFIKNGELLGSGTIDQLRGVKNLSGGASLIEIYRAFN